MLTRYLLVVAEAFRGEQGQFTSSGWQKPEPGSASSCTIHHIHPQMEGGGSGWCASRHRPKDPLTTA